MLNPITYTEKVVSDFLRYQYTTYAFADPRLNEQMRRLLSLEETRDTPLLRGPFISLSRSFRQGASLRQLATEGILHPHLPTLAPRESAYGHQETAFRAIAEGKTTVVSTGTGSGKTECFLYPIISRCLTLRDAGAAEGIAAVIVYPMNALAEDQLGRLRDLLVGSGVSFGMYIGRTPETNAGVTGVRLPPGASRADYRARLEELRRNKQALAVHPPEERVSRHGMREEPPRILLTNVKQLELLLTRQRDVDLFDGALLDYVVMDEAHTYRGAAGAETSCLVRRLRTYCDKGPEETVCIATSATIADAERGPEAGRAFAARFFGVPEDRVALVGEEYEEDIWAGKRAASPPFPGDPAVQLSNLLGALGDLEEDAPAAADLRRLQGVIQAITGEALDLPRWRESLHDYLSANEVVFQIAAALRSPKRLTDLLEDLATALGRPLPEEEVLAWLALGAASRRDGRPLLRPVVHGFVRGVSGAVVTFPPDAGEPRLWLSAEDAAAEPGDGFFRLPVTACTTCGQHYFAHHLADFSFTEQAPGGGEALGDRVIWRPLEEPAGGKRTVLIDRLVVEDTPEDDEVGALHKKAAAVYMCPSCGTLHPGERPRCDGCGLEITLAKLHAVRQKEEHPGQLTSCLACGAIGRRVRGAYREPARPVRATTVADVHVLAQSMIHHAERRRLLVFADNRQDAAFQAGWMRDHARRYRLRALMHERIEQEPLSVGDLTASLDDELDRDDELSRALIPEVWRVARKEAAGSHHAGERRRFLRFQVLREIATGPRQRIGLEPWGRMRVDYLGLEASHPFFAQWAERAEVQPTELREGAAALLDSARRNMILLDREDRIFSRFWHESDRDLQRGYLPLLSGVPKGLKLRREADDTNVRVSQWLSERGDTAAKQSARAWGIPKEQVEPFLTELWELLSDELQLLAPATLVSNRGTPLPGCAGVRQVDADRLQLVPHRGIYRCTTCRRPHVRRTPRLACTVWRCTGTLAPEAEDPENYDLMVLDEQFSMIRPREHSAQVPGDEREVLERIFKGDGELLNTLVCTPTLELGVDIGALDAVLMRNVPPLPANYWQRAGRAGRRHRMATNITYARPASHDRAYFHDPLKMLEGLIRPPSFNLRNDVMIRKHVHATVLTVLHRLARDTDGDLTSGDRQELRETLERCFPPQIRPYLFHDDGLLRSQPLDVGPFETVVAKHEGLVLDHVASVFAQGWPAEDQTVVEEATLRRFVRAIASELAGVIERLDRRLRWALDQMARLDRLRTQRGTLDPEDEAVRRRCDRLIKKVKGIQQRRRQEAEGFDETNTSGVLAAEGFLPGYGLDTGWVVGAFQAPLFGSGMRDWELRRNTALALREYVPGNLVYANGHRYIPRHLHLGPEEPTAFQVDVANESIFELGGEALGGQAGLGTARLTALPICDVDLPHFSDISDDEEYRFQMPVVVLGHEQPRHAGGRAFTWGGRDLHHRNGVHLRLVNVGAASRARAGDKLGYPVCRVCGQSRSPFASQADLDNFMAGHRERCGRDADWIGFYADVVADGLSFPRFGDRVEGYSIVEALRQGAAEVLEMETEDLQLLAVGSGDGVDMLLYDPMPGGSGLLDQMLLRWGEVVAAARQIVETCAAACELACIDCLCHFRNAYYHRYLNRHRAAAKLDEWGPEIEFSHTIPERLPQESAGAGPTNVNEDTLAALLRRAGFPGYQPQHEIQLGRPLGTTRPDFFFEEEDGEGVCIYLDGMSRHIHGNPETRERDLAIREELRNRFYEVFEITTGDLTDREAMRRHFYRLGRILLSKEAARRVREEAGWFEEPTEP